MNEGQPRMVSAPCHLSSPSMLVQQRRDSTCTDPRADKLREECQNITSGDKISRAAHRSVADLVHISHSHIAL
jgi:hypothetical protein